MYIIYHSEQTVDNQKQNYSKSLNYILMSMYIIGEHERY